MPDIPALLRMLQDKDPNKRYDACEELRVAPSIPQEALAALRKATQDSNSSVADAAERALAIQTAAPPAKQSAAEMPLSTSLEEEARRKRIRGIFLAVAVGWVSANAGPLALMFIALHSADLILANNLIGVSVVGSIFGIMAGVISARVWPGSLWRVLIFSAITGIVWEICLVVLAYMLLRSITTIG